MPYTVALPDGRLVEFPDSVSQDQAAEIIRKQLGAPVGAAPSSLQDLAVSLGLGATGATKALTDVFGADNAASQTLESASKSLSGMYTPARQQELARRQELIKQAEKSGSTLEELKAYAGAIGEAPLQSALQGVGSFVPYAVAGAAGAGAKLLPSTIKTIQTIMGAAQGAGAVKGSVYDAVYDRLIQEGKSEPVAREQALAAQSYTEGDLLQQGIGAGLGALGARMGIEGMLVPGAAAKQIPGLGRRVGTAILEEAPIEGLQGGQERLAANLALQKQGYDVPTMQGVLGQAAQEALTAGFAAGPIAAVRSPADAIAAKKREEQTAAVAEQQRLADEEAARVAAYRQTPEYLDEIQSRYTALQQQVRDLETVAKSKPASDDLAGKQAKAQAGRELSELKKSDEYAETVSEYLQAKKLIDEQEAVKQSEKAAAETMRQPGAQADLFGAPTITDMTTKVPKALPTPVEFVDAQNYLQRQIDAAQTAYSTAATPQEARRYTKQYADLQTKLEQLNALRPEIEAEQAAKPEYQRQAFPEQTDVMSVDKKLNKLRTKLQKAQEEGDIEKGSRLLDQIDELNQQPSLFSEENRRPAMEAMENARLAEEIAAGAEEARRTRQRVEQEAAVLQRFGERKGARSPAEQAAYDLRLEEARALMSKFDEGEQDWAALKQDPASVELQEDRDNKRKELADKVDALTEELASAPEADVADAFGRRDKQAVQQELNATTNLLQDLDKRIAIGEKYRRQGAVADTEIIQAKDQRVEDLLDRLLPKAVYSPEKYFAQTTRNLAIKREAEAESKKRDDAFIELAYIYQFAKDKFTNKERNLANKLRVEFVESGVKEVELRRQLAGGAPLEPEAVQELRNQLRMVILDMSRMGIKRNADNSYQYGEVKGFVAEERRKEGAVTPEEAQSLQAELQTLRKYKLETLEPRLAALQQETRYLLRMGDREEDLDFVNERMNSPEIQQLRNRIGSVDLRLNELRAAMEAYVTGEHLENVVVPKVVQGSDADLYERTLAKPNAAVAVLEEQADGIVNRYATTIPDVEPVRTIRRLPLEVAQEQADRLNDLEAQLKNINDRVKRAGRPTKQDKVDALNQLKEERFFIQREIERARENIKRLGDRAPGAAMPAEEQQDLFGPLEAERAVLAEKDRKLNALYDEREDLVAQLTRRSQLGATPELQALADKYAKEPLRLKALDEAIEEMEKERETARGKTSERYNAFKLAQEVGVTLTPEEAAVQRALPGMAPTMFQQGAKPVESATLTAARTRMVNLETLGEDLRIAMADQGSDPTRYLREVAAKKQEELDIHKVQTNDTAGMPVERVKLLKAKYPQTKQATPRDEVYYGELEKQIKYLNNVMKGRSTKVLAAALRKNAVDQEKARADLAALEKRQRAYEQRQAVVEGRGPGELEAERLKAGAGYKTATGAVRKAPRKAASWDLKKEPKAATEKPAAIAAAKTAVDKAESLIKAAKEVVSATKFNVNAVQRAQEANKNLTGAQTMVDMLKFDATTTFSPEKNAAIVEELRRLNAFIAENGTPAQKKEDMQAKYVKEASIPGPGVARLSARLEMAAKQTEKMVRDLTANSELAYENYLAARKAIDDDTSGDYRVFSSLEHKMTKADNKYNSAMNALEKASLAHAVARRDLLGLQKAIGDNVRSMYDRSMELLADAAKELQAVMGENTAAVQQQAQTQAKLDAAEEQLAKARADAQAERNRAKNEEAAADRAKLDAAAAEREAKQRAAEGAGLPGVRVTKETGPLVYAVEANARRMLGLSEAALKKAIADKDPKAAAQARKDIKRYERELAQSYGAAQKVKRAVGEGAVEVQTAEQPVVAGERLAPRRQGPVVKKGTVPPSQLLSGTEESRTPIGKGNRPKQAGVIRLRASDMSPEAANAVSLATLKSQVDAARAGTKRKATLEAKYATAIDGLTAEQVADRLAEGKRLLGSGPTLEIIAAREKYREAVAAEEAANKAKLDAKTPATKELAQDAFDEAAAESDRAEQRLRSLEAAYELEKKKGTASKPAKEAAEEAVEEELGPESRIARAIDDSGLEFSKGAVAKGLTAAALQDELDKAIGGKGVTQSKVRVFDSVADFYAKDRNAPYDYPDLPADAKAFVDPKTGQAVMFANNIGKGDGLGVFLHEVGAHLGFRNLFNESQYSALVKAVKTWASKNDGSLESRVAKAAIDRVESAKTSAEQYDDELLAYAVEEAVKAGTTPSAMKGGSPIKNWLSTVLNLLKKALAKFGINPAKLTAGDLVNLAYGAAQLEVRGTWHGSDATFKEFDTKYAGSGEGAYDRRFDGDNSLGAGPYVTPDKAYGEYYQHAIPFGKAAATTAYGKNSFGDYAEAIANDTQDTRAKSAAQLQRMHESNLLMRYLNSVSLSNGDLDPVKNKAAASYIQQQKEYAAKLKADAEETLASRQKRKVRADSIESAEEALRYANRLEKAVNSLDVSKIKGLSERPPLGNLYRTLDALPREKVYSVNSMAKFGERPAIDALLQKYGYPGEAQAASRDGTYALNGLFYKMRTDLGVDKTIALLKDAGIEAIEQKNDRKYTERAYIDNAPEILATNLRPVGPASDLLFSKQAVESAFIGSSPGKWKTFKENFFGIGGRVQLVDRLAAVDAGIVAAEGAGKLSSTEAFQAQYFMRLADQTTQAAGQFITSGPVSIVSEKRLNGTEYRYQSKEGANLVNMSELMEGAAKAGDMSPQEAERMLTSVVAGERASATPNGWSRLFADNPAAARAEYDKDVAYLKANPEVKRYMDAAKSEYKKYNEGLVDFLAQTGRITKQEADRLKKTPYIPFYRIENGVVKMFTDKEHSIRIGNIKDQPQLERMVGDNKHILPILTSAVQNTFMIANMGMQNKATMETSNAMYKAGFVSRIGEGTGPAGPDVVHYFVNGKPYFAVIDSDTFGIPAHLVVKGMEGIKTTIPALVQALGLPADIVRKFVTRTPAYVIRQLIRDPVNAYITSGVDGAPVINALKQMAKMRAGRSPAEEALMKGLAISSNIYSGNEKDMQKFLQDISSGKGKWDKMLGWLDTLALQADSATRANIYEDSIKKGMSEAQAQFRALESQNFSRRGLSPSMQMISTMVPFFNAQIQGLDVLYRSLTGKVPFAQQLEIRRKIMARGAMLMIGTLAYAMAMKDDDAYKKATPEERYANFFVRLPGVKDPLRIPIPFEIGILFKSLPEAVLDAMQNDTTAKEAAKGLGTVMLQSAPGVIPVGPKPIMEGLYGRTLQGDIESAHEKTLMATERYRETTPEVLKRLGSITGEVGVSPIMLEHLTRGYTGTLGVSALHMLDPLLAEQTNKASQPMSKTPFIGGLFQPEEGRFLINRAYERMDDIVKAKTTYEDMVRRGDRAAAESFAQRYASLLAMSDAAGSFRQRMGEMFADERAIRADPRMSTAEKDALLKRIKDAENMEATAFYAAGERTKPR